MRKVRSVLILLSAVIYSCFDLLGVSTGSASIVLRSAYVNISSDTAQGAVLVKLSGYSTNDVKYRLFNGSSQYACWDNLNNRYVTAASYSSGPPAMGSPSAISEFWIIYQTGTNSSTTASYRDRIGPEYSSNNRTVALPSAIAIKDSFIISGKLIGTEVNTLNQKYVVLTWNGENLVSAASSNLNSGDFSIYNPAGIKIDKIEVRTPENVSIAEITGSWTTFIVLPEIQLTDNPVQDSKLSSIKVNATDLPGFEPGVNDYVLELPVGSISIPLVEVISSNSGAFVVISPATDISGNLTDRTTTISVSSPNGSTEKIYSILFNPILEAETLAEFRNGDSSRIYLISGDLLISYINAYRNQKFIQDTSGAAMIDDPSGVISTIYAIGDKISGLKAKLKKQAGSMELVPCSDPGIPKSSGNEVIPETITISQITDNFQVYEGKFVKLLKVTPFEKGTILLEKTFCKITDGSDTANLFIKYENADYIGTTLDRLCNISGLISSLNDMVQITPRFKSDIYIYNTDATLSNIKINRNTLPGFSPDVYSYAVTLPAGTLTIPEILYETSDSGASVEFINASVLDGNEAKRTCTILVTAEDGISTQKYTLLLTVYAPDSDASLSGLSINGQTLIEFNPGILIYTYILPFGSGDIPFVDFSTTEPMATAVTVNASKLGGTEEERTTKIVITARDGVSQMVYSIIFILDNNVGIVDNPVPEIIIFPVPVTNEITILGLGKSNKIEIHDITGKTHFMEEINADEFSINLSYLQPGIYFLRTKDQTLKFVKL